jgi:hypothetical protein
MTAFREQEANRQACLKAQLFSPEACSPGLYGDVPRAFALAVGRSSENLWTGIRAEALTYFGERRIPWYDGIDGELDPDTRRGPSSHLCCSQSSCVNAWFPFVRDPGRLLPVLRAIGYDAVEMLPMALDESLPDGSSPFLAFEWIGQRDYLAEGRSRSRGRGRSQRSVTPPPRVRGQGTTSADIAVRFRDGKGRVQIVLGAWRYTEAYPNGKSLEISDPGTDRLATYGPPLKAPGCQIRLGGRSFDQLFYDPFDQLMRLQLLASAMEREREMDATVVSILHVAPAANQALMRRITSPPLRDLGSNIHRVWAALVAEDRFRGMASEDVLPVLLAYAPDPNWAAYMALRYGRPG